MREPKPESRARRLARLARALGEPALDLVTLAPDARAAITLARDLGYTDDQIRRSASFAAPSATHGCCCCCGCFLCFHPFAHANPRRTFRPEVAQWIAYARAEGLDDAVIRAMFREALHVAMAAGHSASAVSARWFLSSDPHDPELDRAREGRHEGDR